MTEPDPAIRPGIPPGEVLTEDAFRRLLARSNPIR
jgi:hypothetical protein